MTQERSNATSTSRLRHGKELDNDPAYGLTTQTPSVYIHVYERYKYQRGSEAIIGEIA
jgi:hypothetical protein